MKTKALEKLGASKRDMQGWIKALRSGKYKQDRFRLQTKKGFCCLGVACDLFIDEDNKRRSSYDGLLKGEDPRDQKKSPKWLKKVNRDFKLKTGDVLLTEANDDLWHSFDEIADLLQAVYIEGVLD